MPFFFIASVLASVEFGRTDMKIVNFVLTALLMSMLAWGLRSFFYKLTGMFGQEIEEMLLTFLASNFILLYFIWVKYESIDQAPIFVRHLIQDVRS